MSIWTPAFKTNLSDGFESAINEALETFVANRTTDGVINSPELIQEFIESVPDWVWALSSSFTAGVVKVPEGAFGNAALEQAFNVIVTGILTGSGKGLANSAKAKAHAQTVLPDLFKGMKKGSKAPGKFDLLYRTDILPGQVHLVAYDAAGNPKPACGMVRALREQHRLTHKPQNQGGGGKGQQQKIVPGLAFPEEYVAYEQLERTDRFCPYCVGDATQILPGPKKSTIEKLDKIGLMPTALIFLAKVRDTEGHEDDAIAKKWKEASFESLKAAFTDGLDANGEPKEEHFKMFLAACQFDGGGERTIKSMAEDFAATFSKAWKKGDWSKVKAAFGMLKAPGWTILIFTMIWMVAFVAAFGGFLYAWWTANTEMLWSTMIGTFVLTLFFIPTEKLVIGVWKVLMSILHQLGWAEKPDETTGSWLRDAGRDMVFFQMLFGPTVTFYIEFGWGDLRALQLLACVAASALGATMIGRRWGLGEALYGTAKFRYKFMQGVVVFYFILSAVLTFTTIFLNPYQPLMAKAVDNDAFVVLPNGYELPDRVSIAKAFGPHAEEDDGVTYDATGDDTSLVLAKAGTEPAIPGILLHTVAHDKLVSYEWKVNLTSHWAYYLGLSDAYIAWCYPDASADGTAPTGESGLRGMSFLQFLFTLGVLGLIWGGANAVHKGLRGEEGQKGALRPIASLVGAAALITFLIIGIWWPCTQVYDWLNPKVEVAMDRLASETAQAETPSSGATHSPASKPAPSQTHSAPRRVWTVDCGKLVSVQKQQCLAEKARLGH